MPSRSACFCGSIADAAEDHGVAQRQVLAVGREALADLRRELARRRQHEAADAARTGHRVARHREPLQDRQRERGRLAGAGLREAEQVAPCEDVRDRAALDRGRVDVTLGRHRCRQRWDQTEL